MKLNRLEICKFEKFLENAFLMNWRGGAGNKVHKLLVISIG